MKYFAKALLARRAPLSVLAALTILVPAFQNCSKVQFSADPAIGKANASIQSPGDGDPSDTPPGDNPPISNLPGPTPPPDSNPSLFALKPALAVRNTSCMLCHSSVKGNLITDFAVTAGAQSTFFTSANRGTGYGEYLYPNWNSWGGRSLFATSFIEGKIIVPRRELSASTKDLAAKMILDGKNPLSTLPGIRDVAATSADPNARNQPLYHATAPASVNTVAEYLNVAIAYRTPQYLDVLRRWSGLQKPANVKPEASIREIKSVMIKGPSAAEIRKHITTTLTYQKSSATSLELKNFSDRGGYFGNDPFAEMECDGDLFVDGIVYLKDLKLRSPNGCRIYSTKTIFVEGPAGTALNRKGIQYLDATAKSNLQLASSQTIVLGIGYCTANGGSSFVERTSLDSEMPSFPKLTNAFEDYKLVKDAAGKFLIADAGNCAAATDPRRSVSFERLLVAAPRVDSRYTGDVSGVIIAEHSVWSLGHFHFSYDPVFDAAAILPKLPASDYFQAEDCYSNGVDMAKRVDTNLSACQ